MAESSPKNTRLAETEAVYERLFEGSPNAMLVVDAAGRITRANPQAQHFFGYTISELLGNPVEILIPERFWQAHPPLRDQFSAHPRMRPMGAGLELFGRRKDGTEFPVDIMLSPIDTSEGPVVLTVIREITAHKQTETALRGTEQRFRLLVENAQTITRFSCSILKVKLPLGTWERSGTRATQPMRSSDSIFRDITPKRNS